MNCGQGGVLCVGKELRRPRISEVSLVVVNARRLAAAIAKAGIPHCYRRPVTIICF